MKKLFEPLAVGCGCALGALGRYACVTLFSSAVLGQVVILLINVSGCLLFGFFKVRVKNDQLLQKFLTTGFCGGLTTFSTLMVGATALFSQQIMWGISYLFVTLLLGISAVYGGEKLGQIKKKHNY